MKISDLIFNDFVKETFEIFMNTKSEVDLFKLTKSPEISFHDLSKKPNEMPKVESTKLSEIKIFEKKSIKKFRLALN